jgi:Tol biopolymer transport system component
MRYMSPDLLPGGKSVLVTVTSGGGFENASIHLVSLDTGERRILVERGFHARYAFGYLIYARSDSLMAVPFDIDRLEVSGSPVPVLQGVDSSTLGTAHYSVSRGGSLVYVSTQTAGSVPVWVDRNRNVQPIDVQPRGFWGPRLSPDGSRLAMSANDALMETWMLELDRGALTRFTFEGNSHIPIWTPDGKRLVFSSDREGGAHNLFWKPADGSGEPERLSMTDYHQDPASFSPDGKLLAFAQNHPETRWDIWLLHMDNERRAEPFLQTEFNEHDPMISPDGRWLAYASNESGRYEVYVQSLPNGGKKRVISTEGGREPLWARNGRELFYRNRERLMAVAVETEVVFDAERPRLLFDTSGLRGPGGFGPPNFDVTPDGQHFVMMSPAEASGPGQINVVLNWSEELKRLVPTP